MRRSDDQRLYGRCNEIGGESFYLLSRLLGGEEPKGHTLFFGSSEFYDIETPRKILYVRFGVKNADF